MRYILTLLLLVSFFATKTHAQDLIKTREGGLIQKVKIISTSGDSIKYLYSKSDKEDFIQKSEVFSINRDGTTYNYEVVYNAESELNPNAIPIIIHYDSKGLFCSDKIILVFEGYSKEVLYNLSKQWLIKNYKSEYSFIDSSNINHNVITAVGISKLDGMPVGSMMSHKIKIEIKDFKIRIQYSDIGIGNIASNQVNSLESVFDGLSFLKRNVYLFESDLQNMRTYLNSAKSASDW